MVEAMPSKPEADAAAIGQLFGSALIQAGELWMNTQRELLANIGAVMDGWVQLHRAALDTSSRALQRLHECRDLAELFGMQREWVSDYWQWAAAAVPAIGRDSASTVQTAIVGAREPAETGRADIQVRREPATKSGAEPATAAE
jgi:hypothetical protein